MPAKRALSAELPALFARPPWRAADDLPVIEGLVSLSFAPPTPSAGADRDRHVEPAMRLADLRGLDQVPKDVDPGTPEMDAFVLGRLDRPTRYGASYLSLASDVAAIAYLQKHGFDKLMADSFDLAHLFVRFGPAVEPILRRDPNGAAVLQWLTASTDTAARNVELALRGRYADRGYGEAYLVRYPEAAAIVLLPLALAAATQREAIPLLQKLVPKAPTAFTEVASRYGPAVAAALPALLGYRPPRPVPSVPKWALSAKLPPLVLAVGGALPKSAVREVLVLLRLLSALEWPEARGWLAEVERVVAPGSLAAFVSALFEAWLAAGSPFEGRFVVHALGALGDDGTVHALSARLVPWARENAFPTIECAFEIFREIGSDAALSALAEAADSEGAIGRAYLAERAATAFEYAASRRGMPAEDLADAITPRALDDTSLTTRQVRRLDTALASGRRWTAGRFRAHVLAHPLLALLARSLVWATFGDARMGPRFRITAELELVDAGDRTLTIPEGSTLGLAHPIELDATELAAWRGVLAREGLSQPFPQLDREVYRTTEEERGLAFTRFANRDVPDEMLRVLAGRGWKGIAHDAGGLHSLRRTFAGGLEAEVELSQREASDPRSKHWILGVKVQRHRTRVLPRDVPPGVFSELARALEAFASV